ncbi:hypothetical protein E2C01_083177 [Portunus trituberculatus]|uniref:Uncharacterized protein n=1 Tax=Portunus trituberculatus TaxID=210409 RepID=A0A5B7J3T6_PORTR|nr:hypothetical protein [Portunus trituberculatus]
MITGFYAVTPKMRLDGDIGPNMSTTINEIACYTNGWKLNSACHTYFSSMRTGVIGHNKKKESRSWRHGSSPDPLSLAGSCDFYTSRESFMPFLYCMIGAKHSPLVQSVSKRITWITEAGLYDHWMNSLSSNSTVCERPPTKITVRTPLSLGNVWGMFAILVVGNVVSLLLFLVEVLAGHHLHSLLTATSSWT